MGKHFAKSRLHLTSQICSPGCHRFGSCFLIAATSRVSTCLSAGLRSSDLRKGISSQSLGGVPVSMSKADQVRAHRYPTFRHGHFLSHAGFH